MELVMNIFSYFLSRVILPFLDFVELNILSLVIVSSISSFIIAFILYNSSTAGIGRWIRLLGWVFATFFLIYAIRSLNIYLDWTSSEEIIFFTFTKGSIVTILTGIVIRLLSVANNFLMLIAAKELLSEKANISRNRDLNFIVSFIQQIREFASNKIIILAILAGLLPISAPLLKTLEPLWLIELIIRLPDAVFSSYCFFYLGYAFWVNIIFLQKRWIALAGFLPFVYYLATEVLHLLFPIFLFGKELTKWDRGIYAISLPLKIAIFITAHYLGWKILEVFNEINEKINLISSERINFLSPKGILEPIGKILKADSISLFIRIPSKDFTQASRIKWLRNWSVEQKSEPYVVQLKNFPEVLHIFQTGKIESDISYRNILYQFLTYKNPTKDFKYIPLLFNGAVIGCLKIELARHAFDINIVTKQIELITNRIVMSVQAHRESLSLKYATYNCAKHQFENLKNGSQAVERITATIKDILSPEGIRIIADIGFKQKDWTIAGETEAKILKSLENNYLDNSENLYEILPLELNKKLKSKNLVLREAPLEITSDDRIFGKLFFLIKANKDNINSPTLGNYPMHRRAIGTSISDSIIDLAGGYLNNNLTHLSVKLSQEPISVNKWFSEISKAAEKAELLWTVSTSPNSDNEFLGEEKNIKIIKDFIDKVSFDQTSEKDSKKLFATPAGIHKTAHIISLRLKNTKQTLWFGVENPKFIFEISSGSPWKMFLDHLADIADATLYKIKAQEKQVENTSYHALATMATASGTIVHQLVNMSRNNETGFTAIYEAIIKGELKPKMKDGNEEAAARLYERYVELSKGLKQSGELMLDLTQAFREITKFSEEKPCDLLKACKKAEKLFNLTLAQNNISVKVDVNSKTIVDVPFHIVSLTLANLLSNSKEALKSYKRKDREIYIKSSEENGLINCVFIDNGPGIPVEMQPDLFKLGKTTGNGNGGWGLYLVKRALNENGSGIELVFSEPNRTEFKITLPKANIRSLKEKV